jgi:hypothetical protein
MSQWDDPDARMQMRESERSRIYGKLEPMSETRSTPPFWWTYVSIIILVLVGLFMLAYYD